MAFADLLRLDSLSYRDGQVSIRWSVDDLEFSTAIHYDSLTFEDLVERYGRTAVDRVVFHIALFELAKGSSFGPATFSIPEPWRPYLTAELLALWQQVIHGVWGQWRYEHNRPDYCGPDPAVDLSAPPSAGGAEIFAIVPTGVPNLWFCGGGKDSLLSGHVLRTLGLPFDGLAYSHSVYGPARPQHDLIDALFDVTGVGERRRQFEYDTALDLPVDLLSTFDGVQYLLHAETPASVFNALPLCMAHGYRRLVLSHERSANVGNLIWDATGEDINHQWGKSAAAESLIDRYITEHLTPDVAYVSALQPVFDALIFFSLRDVARMLPAAHSCNVQKPWCMRCAKCAYVWISYMAWLPWSVAEGAFGGVNLLDIHENRRWYREMLGLAGHTPFDCIGQVDEVRLAFKLAHARGLRGAAMEYFVPDDGTDWIAVAERYLRVEQAGPRLLAAFGGGIVDYFAAKSVAGLAYVRKVLG